LDLFALEGNGGGGQGQDGKRELVGTDERQCEPAIILSPLSSSFKEFMF
jgi:hypothetical protein